jgi:hypothetical protein
MLFNENKPRGLPEKMYFEKIGWVTGREKETIDFPKKYVKMQHS